MRTPKQWATATPILRRPHVNNATAPTAHPASCPSLSAKHPFMPAHLLSEIFVRLQVTRRMMPVSSAL